MGVQVIRIVAVALAAAALAAGAQAQTSRPPSKAPPARAAPAQPPPAPVKAPEPVKTSEDLKRESIQGAATAPLRDLNVMRAKIPDILLQAMADPYARPPRRYGCAQLIALVRPLDDALGPDIDRINIEDEDMMDRGRSTALGAAADLASDAIPFRGWVRKLSGAERHDRLVRDAIMAGAVRRAYLKGLGEAKGCNPPATPSHEKAGSPPPKVSRSAGLKPRYPTRPPPAAQQTPGGRTQAAPPRSRP